MPVADVEALRLLVRVVVARVVVLGVRVAPLVVAVAALEGHVVAEPRVIPVGELPRVLVLLVLRLLLLLLAAVGVLAVLLQEVAAPVAVVAEVVVVLVPGHDGDGVRHAGRRRQQALGVLDAVEHGTAEAAARGSPPVGADARQPPITLAAASAP